MRFYRIFGALIMVISGVCGAYMLNGKASGTLRQTDAFIAFLRYVKLQIDCFSLPLGDILSRCDAELLCECGFRGAQTPRDIRELVSQCGIYDTETARILENFSEVFGKSYREEQLRQCDYYISLLEGRREKLSAELPVRKKLNSTLCISGALAVVILLI